MFSLPDRASARLPEPTPKSFTAWAKPTNRASGRASTARAAPAPLTEATDKAARNERRAMSVIGELLRVFSPHNAHAPCSFQAPNDWMMRRSNVVGYAPLAVLPHENCPDRPPR